MAAESAVVLCLRNTFFKGRATRRNIEQNNTQTSIYTHTDNNMDFMMYRKQKFAVLKTKICLY